MPKLPLHHLNRFKALPHSTKRNLIGITGLLLFSILIFLWHYFSTHITTENAYVNANAVRIAAQVSGPVLNLFVDNNQGVTAGQPLFEIDPTPFIAAVDEANAQILQNKAKLKNALINLERVEKLVAQKFLSPESKDNAVTAVDVASADLKYSEAKLVEAQLNLGYTKVNAPVTGILSNLTIRPGTAVTAQIPLFVLISTEQFWVDANYKETELADIHPKQTARIVLDLYPDHTFTGIIDSISASSGTAFSLLPPQNATGNWVKVTQRIPVKVIIQNPDPRYPLRVGATATVTINTASSTEN